MLYTQLFCGMRYAVSQVRFYAIQMYVNFTKYPIIYIKNDLNQKNHIFAIVDKLLSIVLQVTHQKISVSK